MSPTHTPTHDCFLSHNSQDKPAVIELAKALRGRGLTVWLDQDDLRPGGDWLDEIELVVKTCAAALVVVGAAGQGPWHRQEIKGLLLRAAKAKLPIIPVMLAGCPSEPDLPVFLGTLTWVDLRQGLDDDALNRLVWGITGERPTSEEPATQDDLNSDEIEEYRDWVRARYRGVDLIGVGGGELSLDFDQVYIPLAIARRDPLTELEQRDASRHQRVQDQAMEDIEVAGVFDRLRPGQPHAAAFGIPGCGKTTVLLKLQQLCLNARPVPTGLADDTLPLFLPLAQLDTDAMASGEPLAPLLSAGLEKLAGPNLPAGLGERLWQRGRLFRNTCAPSHCPRPTRAGSTRSCPNSVTRPGWPGGGR